MNTLLKRHDNVYVFEREQKSCHCLGPLLFDSLCTRARSRTTTCTDMHSTHAYMNTNTQTHRLSEQAQNIAKQMDWQPILKSNKFATSIAWCQRIVRVFITGKQMVVPVRVERLCIIAANGLNKQMILVHFRILFYRVQNRDRQKWNDVFRHESRVCLVFSFDSISVLMPRNVQLNFNIYFRNSHFRHIFQIVRYVFSILWRFYVRDRERNNWSEKAELSLHNTSY